jgi:2-phospho-L-lactate transferase/gluconeogenesis factor (CofD/UPF0052 family)
MGTFNPTDTVTVAIQSLQDSIVKLSAMITAPGADIPGINKQIRALIAEQTDLRALDLHTSVDSDVNRLAIAAVNAASAALNTEAANIKEVASAIAAAANVVSAASSLITSLAPFLA